MSAFMDGTFGIDCAKPAFPSASGPLGNQTYFVTVCAEGKRYSCACRSADSLSCPPNCPPFAVLEQSAIEMLAARGVVCARPAQRAFLDMTNSTFGQSPRRTTAWLDRFAHPPRHRREPATKARARRTAPQATALAPDPQS